MLRLALIIFVALTSVANAAALYQLTNNSLAANAQSVIREADGATIPPAAGNADWQAYLVWFAVPNTPDPAPTCDVVTDHTANRQYVIWRGAERHLSH